MVMPEGDQADIWSREITDFAASWEDALHQCREKLNDADYNKAVQFSTPEKLLDDLKIKELGKGAKPWLASALSDVRPAIRMIQSTSAIFLGAMSPRKIEMSMVYILLHLLIEVHPQDTLVQNPGLIFLSHHSKLGTVGIRLRLCSNELVKVFDSAVIQLNGLTKMRSFEACCYGCS